MAAAAAGLAWSVLDWTSSSHSHSTMLGMITGAVAGLAAVTPAAGFVDPMGAVAIGTGVVGGLLRRRHRPQGPSRNTTTPWTPSASTGSGGDVGRLSRWASGPPRAVNPAGADGLFHGNAALLWTQSKAVIVTAGYSFVASLLLLKLVDALLGLRVSEENERIGLDLTEHSEAAYTLMD
jgi:Amt family ammonium transporter